MDIITFRACKGGVAANRSGQSSLLISRATSPAAESGIDLGSGRDTVSYEADPRHVEFVVADLKLTEAKGVVTLGTKEEGSTKADNMKSSVMRMPANSWQGPQGQS